MPALSPNNLKELLESIKKVQIVEKEGKKVVSKKSIVEVEKKIKK